VTHTKSCFTLQFAARLLAIFLPLLPAVDAQALFVIADNTAATAGGASFTDTFSTGATTGTAICNGVRIGMSSIMTTSYFPREIDLSPFKTSATAETTGYPILVTVELWAMTSGGTAMVEATPGTPISTFTTLMTTLPGNTVMTVASYVRIALAPSLIQLTAGSSFVVSVNFNTVCSSTLKLSWNRPTHTPTNPVPQTGVTGMATRGGVAVLSVLFLITLCHTLCHPTHTHTHTHLCLHRRHVH
jgi:hypothetical protein